MESASRESEVEVIAIQFQAGVQGGAPMARRPRFEGGEDRHPVREDAHAQRVVGSTEQGASVGPEGARHSCRRGCGLERIPLAERVPRGIESRFSPPFLRRSFEQVMFRPSDGSQTHGIPDCLRFSLGFRPPRSRWNGQTVFSNPVVGMSPRQ